MNGRMSAYGPKQTLPRALHMSAFGGKADLTLRGNPLSRSLSGGKADVPFCAATTILASGLAFVDGSVVS
jgi:hypothetical protein